MTDSLLEKQVVQKLETCLSRKEVKLLIKNLMMIKGLPLLLNSIHLMILIRL